MRFVCDEMLGHLARDLRILGYDTQYMKDVGDDEVLERATTQGRALLTRDRVLATRAGAVATLVRSLEPAEQLDEVLAALGLRPDPARFLTRCTDCNGELEDVAAADVAGRLPPSVLARHARVWRCRDCAHLYWEGAHVRDMRRRLGQYLS